MALPKTLIENWKKQKHIKIEGYRSTSQKLGIAKHFAKKGMSEDKGEVILKFTLENKNSKCYVCLDREDYTIYPDEEEILLQAGLVGVVRDVKISKDGKLTTFDIYISDKLV